MIGAAEDDGARRPTLDEFDYAMRTRGWIVLPSIVAADHCTRLNVDIMSHVERCGALQVAAGLPGTPDGTSHHAVGHGDSLDEFLEATYLDPYIDHFLDHPWILHAFNPIVISGGRKNYVQRIHKDTGTYSGSFRFMLNVLVMVAPFTLENGATYMLSGSQNDPRRPTDEFFHKHAERLVGAQGSVVLFDSNLWHAAGDNISGRPRTALTMSVSRPFIKPQMDYARYLGAERGAKMPERMRQLFGYNARVPTNLDEWYRPVGTRMYRGDQG
jgi:Phytanoyl-CoA dioxygenase (PhyH)